MMNDSLAMEAEKRSLRWGGLAGVFGGILSILVFVIVIVFVGSDLLSAGPEEMIKRFPEIRSARTVENGLYLVVLILWVAHFLALYRTLRETSHAPALFGSVLGIAGLGVLAAGSLPHVATAPISDLYHASGATPEVQTTLVAIWQATQGIFDAVLFAGMALLPIGLIALGVAMFGTPAFGKRLGRVSVGLGAIGVAAAAVVLIDPLSPIAAVGFFALIAFHLIVGLKTYRLSMARARRDVRSG